MSLLVYEGSEGEVVRQVAAVATAGAVIRDTDMSSSASVNEREEALLSLQGASRPRAALSTGPMLQTFCSWIKQLGR